MVDIAKNYCQNCKLQKEKPDYSDSDFCEIGYTVAPRTELATIEVAKSGGIYNICSFNPWRRKLIERMGAGGGSNWQNTLANIKRGLQV